MCNKILQFVLMITIFIGISAGYISAAPYYGWTSEETVDADTLGLWHWNASDGNAINAVSGGLPLEPNGTVSYVVNGGKFGNGTICTGAATGKNYWKINNTTGLGYNMDATGPDPSFSVAAWIKPNVLPDSGLPRQVIVDKAFSNTPSAGYNMFLYYWNGVVYLKADIGTTAGTMVEVSVPSYLTVGQWAHVAVTWNAADDTLRLYKNGVLIGSTVSAGKIYAPSIAGSTNPQILRVGERLGASYGAFNGIIDDLKISKVAIAYAAVIPNLSDGDYYNWDREETVDNRTIALWNWNVLSGPVPNLADSTEPMNGFGAVGYAPYYGKFNGGGTCPGGAAVSNPDYWQNPSNGGHGLDVDSAGTDPNISVAMWIKPLLLPPSTADANLNSQALVDKASWTDARNGGFQITLDNTSWSGGSLILRGCIGVVPGGIGTGVVVSAPACLVNGEWAHVAMVWNAKDDTLRLYKNGVLLASTVSAGSVYFPSNGYNGSAGNLIRVGQRLGPNPHTFNGIVDELKISNAALVYKARPVSDISGANGIQDGHVNFLDLAQLAQDWLK